MKKKLLSVFFLFMFCLLCAEGVTDTLTDDDAGALLYYPEEEDVLVLQKIVKDENESKKLECKVYRGSSTVRILPLDCIFLNQYEQNLTPEIVIVELAYWRCKSRKKTPDYRVLAYYKIAKKMNTSVINDLLQHYAYMDESLEKFREKMESYRKADREARKKQSNPRGGGVSVFRSSCSPPAPSVSTAEIQRKLLEKELSAMIRNNPSGLFIMDAVNKGNFFLASCLYIVYARDMWNCLDTRPLLKADLRKKLKNEILDMGKTIREGYNKQRQSNKNREENFKKLCHDKYGPWAYASPTNWKEMAQSLDSCYKAWQKIHRTSPHTEFPEWGSAMLEFLQMVRSSQWEQKYDDAYSEYRKDN